MKHNYSCGDQYMWGSKCMICKTCEKAIILEFLKEKIDLLNKERNKINEGIIIVMSPMAHTTTLMNIIQECNKWIGELEGKQ